MSFILETGECRNNDVGDWIEQTDGVHIKSVKLGNEDHEFLVQLHELVEYYLCKKHGVTDEVVTAYDAAYNGPGLSGDNPLAPYHLEHDQATVIERLMAHFLGVDWQKYDQEIENL